MIILHYYISTNGTYINRERIPKNTPTVIENGAELALSTIGNHKSMLNTQTKQTKQPAKKTLKKHYTNTTRYKHFTLHKRQEKALHKH